MYKILTEKIQLGSSLGKNLNNEKIHSYPNIKHQQPPGREKETESTVKGN